MKVQYVSVNSIVRASTSITSFKSHNNPDRGAYFTGTDMESSKDWIAGSVNLTVSGRADDVHVYDLEVTISHLLKTGLIKTAVFKHGRLDPLI